MRSFPGNEPVSLPPEICSVEESSFARYTLLNRFPHILEQIINDNDYDYEVIIKLRALFDDVSTGRIAPLKKTGQLDSEAWENCIQRHEGKSWFEAPFFFVEMYFYRRILEIVSYFDASDNEERDPFALKKRKSFSDSLTQVRNLIDFLHKLNISQEDRNDQIPENLENLISADLWSNCADLSQLPKTANSNQLAFQAKNSSTLLINDVSTASAHIARREEPLLRVDIVLVNAGIELISDLALADFLITNHLADQVILHCKRFPVLVSDATVADIMFVINDMQLNKILELQKWGQKLNNLIEQGSLKIQNHSFWTLPLYFREMPADILSDIQTSDLLISKGDANYRRLLDDRHWEISTPVEQITNYLSTHCLALRVLKSEILAGMDLERLNSLDLETDWMTSGSYGIVQFIPPNPSIIHKD